MKRRRTDPRPASKDAIKKNPKQFIIELPKRYRGIESGYNRNLYAVMAECATLAQLAAEDVDIAEEIRTGKHWTKKRQQCPDGEYVRLVVHHMLQPEGKNEQSKASKWTAVIEHLSNKGGDGDSIVETLTKAGGIEEIYAETTGRNVAKAKSGVTEAREKIDGDTETGSEGGGARAAADPGWGGSKRAKLPKSDILEVMLESLDLDTVLNSRVVLLIVTNKGSPVPGKPEGFKRVVGRIKKIVK